MLFHILLQICLATLAWGQVSINTPTLTQCERTTISWSGGTGPYMVYVYPESYLDESSYYERLGPFTETSTTYTANLEAGERLRINVRDIVHPGFEDSAFTDAIAIGEGTSNFCLATGPTGGGVVGPGFESMAPTGFDGLITGSSGSRTSVSSQTSSRSIALGSITAAPVSQTSSVVIPSLTRSVGGGPDPSDTPNSGSAVYGVPSLYALVGGAVVAVFTL